MAEERGGGAAVVEGEKKEAAITVTTKKRRGIVSRIWNGLFRLHGDDFEKRLQYISKEEANVLKRMNRRAMNGRKRLRQLIYFSVLLEIIAVGYAIMTTRTVDLDWRMRAIRVLPMFVLPAVSSAIYSVFVSLTKMWERKDQKLLEKLRAERQEKIDELKERTNYYTTQQLIQRYDPDPAAKAAAASVLASKLGADSGLKVYLEDESEQRMLAGKSKDAEFMQTSGLRNRKQAHNRSSSVDSGPVQLARSPEAEMLHGSMHENFRMTEDKPLAVAHHDPQTPTTNDGGWIARLAALLVGEDPTQSYALICGNCHMHNGLVRKEDFPFVTYFCPHCQVLNQPKQLSQRASGSSTPELRRGGSIDTIPETPIPELRRGGSIDTIPETPVPELRRSGSINTILETPETVLPRNEEAGSETETNGRVASGELDS